MICICVSMTMEIVVDAASFDPELLQLNEVGIAKVYIFF